MADHFRSPSKVDGASHELTWSCHCIVGPGRGGRRTSLKEDKMFVRVMTTTLKPDLIDEAAREWRDHIEPFKTNGLQKAYMLVDRATGKYLSITIWPSEEVQRRNAASPSQIAGRDTMTRKYFEAAPQPAVYELVATVE
jgi:heme-degrading monooxygenase HmoA